MAKHTPTAEQKRLVAQWWRTGQSKSVFAQSIGVHPSTFGSWTRRHSSEGAFAPPRPPVFLDVTPGPVSTVLPAPAPPTLSVRLGAPGVPPCELEFDAMPSPAWFAAVLREVAAC